MPKKSRSTQELANGFPRWTKVRWDDQSVGKTFLNVIGKDVEKIRTELYRNFKNTFLSTSNVDEVDITYTFDLPNSFEFTVDDSTQLSPVSVSPTVSGLIDGTWYEIDEATTGSLEEFWYESVPDRIEIIDVISGITYNLVDNSSDELVYSGINDLFEPNKLYITVSSGVQLFETADNNEDFKRATILVTGTTWKGTEEQEELGFLYNQTLRSEKVWSSIDKIETIDFPTPANISIQSHAFLQDNIEDTFSTLSQFTDGRDNLPHFWNLEESCWVPGLQLLSDNKYVVDTAINVLRNRTELEYYRQWELLDENENTIIPLDIAPVPYKQRTWAVSASGLYLYDLDWEISDMKKLTGKTSGAVAQIEINNYYPTRDEEVEVLLRLIRPIRTAIRHRLSIEFPDGISYGILADGTLVSITSDYWVENFGEQRLLRGATALELDDIGEHILTLEVLYVNNITEIDKKSIVVAAKTPMAEFDLYSLIGKDAKAIDIDHQHKLIVLDIDNDVHYIKLHYDTMLIDYDNKQIIFREPYEQVKVIK